MRILLVGGTDLTLAVAGRLLTIGMPAVGCIGLGPEFQISYSRTSVTNARHADMSSWCSVNDVSYSSDHSQSAMIAFANSLSADFCLVAGWYYMLPPSLRRVFRMGCAGIHASLLPKLRGGAPLNWAILSGLRETGVTMFELGDGTDDGPVYGQRVLPLHPRMSIAELIHDSHEATIELISDCLPRIADGSLKPGAQVGIPTHCLSRTPEDGRIDWRRTAVEIDRLVRAAGRPYPGAFSVLEDRKTIIWRAHPLDSPEVWGAPGQIMKLPDSRGVCAVTGHGLLRIDEATDQAGVDAMTVVRASAIKRFERC